MKNNSTYAEFVLWNQLKSKNLINHPGRESTIVNISKSAIPATSRLKREEIYLFINQIIIVVFTIKIFLKLTAMHDGAKILVYRYFLQTDRP